MGWPVSRLATNTPAGSGLLWPSIHCLTPIIDVRRARLRAIGERCLKAFKNDRRTGRNGARTKKPRASIGSNAGLSARPVGGIGRNGVLQVRPTERGDGSHIANKRAARTKAVPWRRSLNRIFTSAHQEMTRSLAPPMGRLATNEAISSRFRGLSRRRWVSVFAIE
jgi:hypothetical protein